MVLFISVGVVVVVDDDVDPPVAPLRGGVSLRIARTSRTLVPFSLYFFQADDALC